MRVRWPDGWPAEEPILQLSSAARWITDAKIETSDRRSFGKLVADRLAALLLDAAEHDAALARSLRIEAAAHAGAIRPLRRLMPR